MGAALLGASAPEVVVGLGFVCCSTAVSFAVARRSVFGFAWPLAAHSPNDTVEGDMRAVMVSLAALACCRRLEALAPSFVVQGVVCSGVGCVGHGSCFLWLECFVHDA